LFLFAETEDINYLQYGQRVKDKNTDEPRQMFISGGSPQGYAFPWKSPEGKQEDDPIKPDRHW